MKGLKGAITLFWQHNEESMVELQEISMDSIFVWRKKSKLSVDKFCKCKPNSLGF